MEYPPPNPLASIPGIDEGRPPLTGIDGPFRRWVRETPEAAAVVQGKRVLSYAELDGLAERFAARVLERALPDGPVILFARRSAALVVAILGCVRAGRAFALFDAAYPGERLRRQGELLSPSLVVDILVDLDLDPDLHLGADIDITAPTPALREAFPASLEVPSWSYALPRAGDACRGAAVPAVHEAPSATAYFSFTSGTTGRPKCIRTGHAPLLHFLEFYRRAFAPQPHDRFSILSGLGHDPLLRDVFVPLSCGARIMVPDENIVRSPPDLYTWLARAEVTFMHTTPQLLRLATAGRNEGPASTKLTHVFSGGDVLLRSHVEAVRAIAPNAAVINFYGASETPQAMAYHRVCAEDLDPVIPLGRGIDDVELLVLGDDLRRVGPGQVGQIGIRTRFLSDGYVGDSGDMQATFVTPPDRTHPDERIYLTGDFGYARADGTLIGTGRRDDQVKIRGYRVELAEVRRAIEETGQVDDAAVIAHAGAAGENRLLAFVVPSRLPRAKAIAEALRATLQERLPAPMVPSRIVVVDAIPLSPNGKVDRGALARLLAREQRDDGPSLRHDPALDEPLRLIIGIIEDELDTTVRDLEASFIDLGGDSLSYVRACTAIQDAIGFLPRDWASCPLRDFTALFSALRAESAQPAARRPRWTRVEFPVFLRALSIVLVVMNHAHVGSYLAATATLFVVSGASFGRFLAPQLRQAGGLRPTLRFVARFAAPAFCWQLLQALRTHNFWWPNLFLLGTFFQNPANPVFGLWYLDVLGANVLLLALALRALRGVRQGRSPGWGRCLESPFAESLLVLVVACLVATAQIRSGWWNGEVGFASVAPFKWLWMLALGMAIQESRRPTQRLAVTGLTLALYLFAMWAAGKGLGWIDGMNPYFLITVALMPWVRAIPVPRVALRPIVVVASSTLFIYIVNWGVIYTVMPRLGLPAWPVLVVGLPVVVGILASAGWTRTERLAAVLGVKMRGRAGKRAEAGV